MQHANFVRAIFAWRLTLRFSNVSFNTLPWKLFAFGAKCHIIIARMSLQHPAILSFCHFAIFCIPVPAPYSDLLVRKWRLMAEWEQERKRPNGVKGKGEMTRDSTGQDWKNTEGDKLTEKYAGNTISFIGVVTAAFWRAIWSRLEEY